MDGKTIQPPAPIKPIITVWAEEKRPLGDGHSEFSFGNGSSGHDHAYGGYCMSAPGRIIRGSLTVTESRNILSEEVKVNIVVNGKEQVNQSIVKKSGDICSCTIFRFPIELKQCDTRPHSSVVTVVDLKTRGCGFDSLAGKLTIINCHSDETLNRGPV